MPAISPNRPAVSLVLDRPRDFRFTWGSGNRFEEAYGKSLPRAFAEDSGVRLVTYLTWAGLLHAEPALKLFEVERRLERYLVVGGDIGVFYQSLLTALLESGVIGKKADPKTDPDTESDEDAEGKAEPVA